MSDATGTAQLEQLLVDAARSLLQYVGECWPWASSGACSEAAATQARIDSLVRRQQTAVERLADLLASRGVAIDFGAFPTEYTDLHYCALDFLLSQLVANTAQLCRSIDAALATVRGDASATAVLQSLAGDHQKILEELKTLRAPRTMVTV